MDKLEIMYKLQYDLQDELGTIKKFKSNESMKQQFINQMILAIHEEATEIMKETAYKNPEFVPFGWKKNQKFHKENFKNEIVDLMHFILNLAIVAEMSPMELFDRYQNKNFKNSERKKNEY